MAEFGGDASMPIAVIGMACRFPGDATSPDRLWELLVNGRNAWSEFPKDRINIDGFYHPSGNRQGSICFKGGHFLKEDVAAWDAPFFSITAHEAAAMDPQQRILLEVSYEAFENAGVPMGSLPGSATAVYCGSFVKDYEQIVLRDPDDSPQYAATGNGIAIMSNRISWFYDLNGPSMTLDTGCSASLVGVHLACQSLRTGESTMAMAMGAGLILTPATMMPMTALNFLSPDGKCFTFDERANGYGRGEGIGAVLLKPLEAALRDNDTIRAIIRGSGVNQDGRTPGITMPSSEAQALNTRAVYKMAGLGYDRTAYFEAHGTGTQAGDPTELRAISDTFARTRDPENPCFLKTNIGHLEGCAGIAGFVKGVLMLENGQIPPNLNFEKVNPNIDLDGWRIKVPTSLTPWPIQGLRRVSINCFGFGGTNAHIIMDDALHYLSERNLNGKHCTKGLSPSPTPSEVDSGVEINSPPPDLQSPGADTPPTKKHKLYVLSSHEENGITRLSTAYSEYLNGKLGPGVFDEDAENLGQSLAYTLACRRSKLGWKSFFVSSSPQKLSSEFSSNLSKPIRSSQIPSIGFVFSGQGAQWYAMGRELLQYPKFSESLKDADSYLATIGSEWSLMTELLRDEGSSIVNLPRISQPLCTALQVALVDLLESWNVRPNAVVGHSSGEIAAAYALGALSRVDCWKLAFHRGRLTSSIKDIAPQLKGRMMAVALSKDAAEAYTAKLTTGEAIVACINSPENCTISGDESAVLELQDILSREGIFARILKVENAYHSSHMRPIENDYLQAIEDIRTLEKSPGKMMFSSVTGQSISSEELGPSYWTRNMVSPVRFSEALQSLIHSKTSKPDILLEIGPHAVLQGPLKQILDAEKNQRSRPEYLSMLYRGKDAVATSLEAVGNLWAQGSPVQLTKINQSAPNEDPQLLADLPVYPWNHSKTYWHESHLGEIHRFREYARQDLIGEPTIESTFFEPRWRGFIRVSENPWVQDHQVQNTIIYPAAGMITMVLEAARQLQDSKYPVEGYEVSNMEIDKAMLIPTTSHGLETSLTMKRHEVDGSMNDASSQSFDFVIYSKIRDAPWQKNASGLLQIRYKSIKSLNTSFEAEKYRNSYLTYQQSCTEAVVPRQLYETLESIGMKYGPMFQNITEVKKKDNVSCTTVRIPDTKATMPAKYEYPHLLHPATLDAMFQTVFVAGSEPMVPSFLESIFVSADFPQGAGAELQGYSTASRKGFRDALGNIVMSDGSWETPKIIVKNLHFTALSASPEDSGKYGFLPNHHNLCSKLIWNEDISSAKPTTLSEWFDLTTYKNPDMGILDTCGTGSIAHSIFNLLGKDNASTPRFSRYTFTAATSENFDEVEKLLQNWPGYADFKVLDFNTDLLQQGFKERSFDLVLTNNAELAHLTALKGLIKPQGRLILIPSAVVDEVKVADSGSADQNLVTSSIAPAVDIALDAPSLILDDIEHTLKNDIYADTLEARIIRVSSKDLPANLSSRDVVLLLPVNPSQSLHELASRLKEAISLVGANVEFSTLVESAELISRRLCLALLEVDGPLISQWTAQEFEAFRSIISKSKGCLWVTKGGQMSAGNPFSAPATALFRTIRSEDPQKAIYTLDLNATTDLSSDFTGRAVLSTFIKSFDSVSRSDEMEYTELDGKVFLPRAILEEQLSSRIERGDAQREPQQQLFFQAERSLQLEIGALGKLDSLHFNDDPSASEPLGSDEVEIRVQAVGISPADVKTVLGQTSRDTIGSDVAGFVSRIGANVSKFSVGDRAVTIVPGAFKNVVRCHENMVQSISESMSFEVAASLPTDYLTAYYAIITVGRLQKDESILVYTGISGVGRASIEISKFLDAEIFVTVSTTEEQAFVTEKYGIPENHIFNVSSGGNLDRLNEGRGYDLILNSFGGKPRKKALNGIAEYGRFVDVGVNESTKNGPLDNQSSIANVTYSTVDIEPMVKSKVHMASRLLQSTFDIIREKLAGQINDPKIFPFSEITNAFQAVHDGKYLNKVVLKANETDLIPVIPREEHPLKLDEKSTYVLVGGLGGLGRSLAGLLVDHGAKNLAFLSRSGAVSGAQIKFLESLKQAGIDTRSYSCDICDESQVAATIAKCAEEMPKIRGVIQAAAVIRDAIFENMTYDDWTTAIRPKIQGSWNLHTLMPKDMDFFVFLSSSAGVIGARGQANYAAGNGFQDALAQHRRMQGLTAVSLDLGPILGAGMVAEDDATLDILRQSGFLGVREQDFHLLVSAAITGYTIDSHPTPAQVIIGTATGGIIKQNQVQDPYWHATTLFSLMSRVDLSPTTSSSSPDTISMADLLSAAISFTEARAIVTEGLAQLLSRSMNMSPADLDTRKPATTYGVDSLVAVGTRNWIFRETGVDVSVFEILSDTSIEEFAGGIAGKCRFVREGLRGEDEEGA